MKEFKQKFLYKILEKKKLSIIVMSIFGLFVIFSFFLPYVYTLNKGIPTWVNGFNMLSYLEDDLFSLHYGVNFFLIGYIFGVLLFPIGIISIFIKDEYFKFSYVMMTIILGVTCVCNLIGLIMLHMVSNTGIYPEFGSYVTTSISYVVLVIQLILYILYNKKTKAS